MNTNDARTVALIIFAGLTLGCGSPRGGGDCEAGEAGCACLAANTCTGGAVCVDGLCEQATELTLEVDDVSARACEAILLETDTAVAEMRFVAGVDGAFVRESPRTAASFSVREDRRLPSVGVQVVGAGTLQVSSSRCFDGAGNTIAGAAVTIRD